MIKLYGSYTSPYVRHCRIVLLETKQDFELVLTDAQLSSENSPAQKVPFLQDADIKLSDSTSIIRYLREKAGQHVEPSYQELEQFCLINTGLDLPLNNI